MSNPSLEPKPNPEGEYSGVRGRLRWLGTVLTQEAILKPVLQGAGMTIGAIIVEKLGGNLQDVVYVGALGGFAVGTVVGEIAWRVRRRVVANS